MPEPTSTPELVSTGQRLLIEDLELRLRIGVSAAERSAPQRLLVSLAVEVTPAAPRNDSVDEVVDYGVIAQGIRALATREVKLLETLAWEIAALALADPRALAVDVTLRKPDLFDDVRALGIVQRFTRGLEPPGA